MAARGRGRLMSRRGFLLASLALALPANPISVTRIGGSGGRFEASASPGSAARLVSRDESLGGGRFQGGASVVAARAAPPFNMVGLHWRGSGDLWFRAARTDRAFGAWQRVECCEGPDVATAEAGLTGWHLGKPTWTGPAERIQYRVRGDIRDLRAHFVLSEPAVIRRLAIAGTPSIIPRAGWNANERIVRARPKATGHLRLALVHHTAGLAPSTPEESAAIILGIQEYHVNANGWNDIGYNFLVDGFGQIFEGRAGGVEQNVLGAHARGFNAGSVGIALLGHYQLADITAEARAALVNLLTWRLDIAHLDPQTLPSIVSGGNGRYPKLVPVTLRAVSGHRDTGLTICPGNHLYSEINAIAVQAATNGLPKLYEPRVEGNIGSPVRFTARLSEDLPWSVSIADEAGTLVAELRGMGAVIDTTWDASAIPGGHFVYTIGAGESVRAATGIVGPPEPEPPPEPPPRPDGIPKRVPRWAFDMYVWHNTPRTARGPRPDGPRRLPRWYWKWHKWRLARARFFTELAAAAAE